MAKIFNWQTEKQTVILRGTLDRDTLLPLWQQREQLLDGIRFLEVSDLRHVDSAGVALVLHFYYHQRQRGSSMTLIGITDRMRTLIALYKLQNILPCAQTASHDVPSSAKL